MPGSASLGLRAFSDSQNLLCPHTRQTRSTRELTPKDWWQLVYKFSSSFAPQATYNSAFTFCLCRAQGSARGAGLRLSRVFCEHASWPWACRLHSEFPSIHSSHVSLRICFLSLLPRGFGLFSACPIFRPLPLPWAAIGSISLNVFNRWHLAALAQGCGGKQRSVSQGNTGLVKRHNQNCLRTRSISHQKITPGTWATVPTVNAELGMLGK